MTLPNEDHDLAGDLKPLDRNASPADLIAMVENHRRSILESRGDVASLNQKIDRMLPELQQQLQRAKEAARMEWIPGGDSGIMEGRYLQPDGTVRLGRSVAKALMPDDSGGLVEVEEVRHGLLTDPYPATEAQQRAQDAYASLSLAHFRARKLLGSAQPWADPLVRKSYLRFRRSMMELPGRVGEFCRRMFTDPELFKRVVSNTSGTGGQLISVPTISQVRRPADLQRRLVGMVRTQEVLASSFKAPIVTGRALAKKRGATTDDPARYPVRTFTTSDTTLTVVNQELTALVDPLWAAEASNVLDDPMGFINDWLMRGWADTWEASYLHGDTAGSHQDTIASWTLGSYYTAGDLDGSNSPLKWYIGFRARAFDDSATASAGGTFDAADHFGALELLGTHATGRVVAFTGLHCLYTQLLSFSSFLTVDAFGEKATLLTGQVGSIGNTPIVISEFVTNDVANTGLYTGSGTTTYIAYADLDAWTYYEHNPGTDEFDVVYPERGARYIGATKRGLLAPTCISTEKPCAVLYNL